MLPNETKKAVSIRFVLLKQRAPIKSPPLQVHSQYLVCIPAQRVLVPPRGVSYSPRKITSTTTMDDNQA